MSKKKSILSEDEILKPFPALVLPEETEVVLPDANNKLAAQKEFLGIRLQAVLGMEMTEANIEKVRIIKKAVVGWRNAFDKQCKDFIKGVYKGPMDVFKAAAAPGKGVCKVIYPKEVDVFKDSLQGGIVYELLFKNLSEKLAVFSQGCAGSLHVLLEILFAAH